MEEQGDEGEYDDVMPGFHEHDEHLGFEVAEDEGAPVAGPSKPRPRPPVSAPACSPPITRPIVGADISDTKGKAKARARSTGPESGNPQNVAEDRPELPTSTMLECPICQKQLQTDNSGLNAHVDWCLSKGAIWDAQAETVASTPNVGSKKGASIRGTVKPDKDGTRKVTTKKTVPFNWGRPAKEKGKG